jgi:hypothetical protein
MKKAVISCAITIIIVVGFGSKLFLDLLEGFGSVDEFLNVVSGHLGASVFVLAALLVLILAMIPPERCPECNEVGTMESTGHIKKGGLFVNYLEEYRCSKCGHVKWKADYPA